MSALQIISASGCILGLGLALLLVPLLPAQPHLVTVLDRLNPDRRTTTTPLGTTTTTEGAERDLTDKVGIWAQRRLPAALWFRTPTQQLRIIRKPLHRYLGEKLLYTLLGLLFPPVLGAFAHLLGLGLPFAIPVVAGLILGAALSFIPDYNARDDAKTARDEFTRSLGAYIDQVALERAGSSGTVQSMERAAHIGDSWRCPNTRTFHHHAHCQCRWSREARPQLRWIAWW